MPSYNRFIGVGHLTRVPELRYTPEGTSVATCGLAMNRRFRQGDELKEELCFIDLTAWGKQAETIAQYADKGDPLLIEGRLTQRSWETDDGQRRHKHGITVEAFQLLRKKDADEH
jgi:single-strand DNA-binding protein